MIFLMDALAGTIYLQVIKDIKSDSTAFKIMS